MMPGAASAMETAVQRLAPYPWLRSALERFVERLSAEAETIVLRGSVGRGEVDRYSDLDLAVVPRASGPEAALHACRLAATDLGTLLTMFPADHLGLDDLWVTLTDVGGRVAKVDVELVARAELRALPHDLVVAGRRTAMPRPSEPPRDLAGAAARAGAWIWYTHCRIRRGERFEAADALDTLRKQVILPMLLTHHGFHEGYRRLDQRLPDRDAGLLERTYPRSLDPSDLDVALKATSEAVLDLQARLTRAGVSAGEPQPIAVVARMVEVDRR